MNSAERKFSLRSEPPSDSGRLVNILTTKSIKKYRRKRHPRNPAVAFPCHPPLADPSGVINQCLRKQLSGRGRRNYFLSSCPERRVQQQAPSGVGSEEGKIGANDDEKDLQEEMTDKPPKLIRFSINKYPPGVLPEYG
ncbi:hypothetical protein ZHAS_00020417 [Anopheles sinensis]|uniref:Uncharacterized protein n=1 Tax=Anopheles sinensis TaxID=74873 RepID=A0A084WQ03_ANOSI|nr:hypothetical protein ZHAS_00020417 [Anopheles sinensis]